MSQEKKVGTFTIDTSSSASAPIWTFWHNFGDVAALHFPSRKNDFRNFSWNLHFRLQFRSNFQQVGQIIVVQHNMPPEVIQYLLEVEDASAAIASNYGRMTMLPHTKVPMGEDTDVHVEMPWNLPEICTYASLGNYNYNVNGSGVPQKKVPTMGCVMIVPAIQMQVAANVNPQMTVEIWSWLTDLRLSGYDPRSGFIT